MGKKILVLASTFPRWENDSEPGFVKLLSQELSKKYEVHILAPHFHGSKKQEILDNLKIFRYQYFFSKYQKVAYNGGILENLKGNKWIYFQLPFFLLFQLLAIKKLHRRNNYDALHAHWIIPQGLVAAIYQIFKRRENKLPFLLTSHGGDLLALNAKWQEKLKIWVLNRCSHITVVSEFMKTECCKMGIDSKKISVGSMGVNLTDQFIPPHELNKRNPHQLIFVGRLVEKKGVEVLIRSMPHIIRVHRDARLRIYGDGPLRSALEELCKSLELTEFVEFLGARPNRELPLALQTSSIAVIPSIIAKDGDQEGLGLTIVEAMGCECAVVASDLPAIRDVIPNDDIGLRFQQKDELELANSIISLIDTPDRLKKVAKNGRIFVNNKFNWQAVGTNYIRIIERAIENNS